MRTDSSVSSAPGLRISRSCSLDTAIPTRRLQREAMVDIKSPMAVMPASAPFCVYLECIYRACSIHAIRTVRPQNGNFNDEGVNPDTTSPPISKPLLRCRDFFAAQINAGCGKDKVANVNVALSRDSIPTKTKSTFKPLFRATGIRWWCGPFLAPTHHRRRLWLRLSRVHDQPIPNSRRHDQVE